MYETARFMKEGARSTRPEESSFSGLPRLNMLLLRLLLLFVRSSRCCSSVTLRYAMCGRKYLLASTFCSVSVSAATPTTLTAEVLWPSTACGTSASGPVGTVKEGM